MTVNDTIDGIIEKMQGNKDSINTMLIRRHTFLGVITMRKKDLELLGRDLQDINMMLEEISSDVEFLKDTMLFLEELAVSIDKMKTN